MRTGHSSLVTCPHGPQTALVSQWPATPGPPWSPVVMWLALPPSRWQSLLSDRVGRPADERKKTNWQRGGGKQNRDRCSDRMAVVCLFLFLQEITSRRHFLSKATSDQLLCIAGPFPGSPCSHPSPRHCNISCFPKRQEPKEQTPETPVPVKVWEVNL